MNDKGELELRRAVVFSILMQGIEDKSPRYVREKWLVVKENDYPEGMLDSVNKEKLNSWYRDWRNCFPDDLSLGQDKTGEK